MDINEKIRLIADGEFEMIAKLSVDETTELCRLVRGLRGSLEWVTQERDALRAQLETTQRELTATTISWENALAELRKAREQEHDGFIVGNTKYSDEEVAAIFEGDTSGGYFVFKAPVPAMPIPKQEPVVALRDTKTAIEIIERLIYENKDNCSAFNQAVQEAEDFIKLLSSQSPAVAVPDNPDSEVFNSDYRAGFAVCSGYYQRALRESGYAIAESQSPRITEQDARYKKLLSLAQYYLHCAEHEDRVPYAFFHSEFSALLNKTNGDHNGK